METSSTLASAPTRRRPSYFWIIATTLAWPLVLTLITILRFGRLPSTETGIDLMQLASGLISFALLGAVSGWFMLWLARRGPGRAVIVGTLIGYVIAAPIAFIVGLVAPITLEVLGTISLPSAVIYLVLFPIGILIAGGLQLAIGSLIGWAIGRAVASRKD